MRLPFVILGLAQEAAAIEAVDDYLAVVRIGADGFHGANSWYLNDTANAGFAAEAPGFGRLDLPVLFVHAVRDTVCDTVHSALAEPMREDCANLSEATIEAGHSVMLEAPDPVNEAIDIWVRGKECESALWSRMSVNADVVSMTRSESFPSVKHNAIAGRRFASWGVLEAHLAWRL